MSSFQDGEINHWVVSRRYERLIITSARSYSGDNRPSLPDILYVQEDRQDTLLYLCWI